MAIARNVDGDEVRSLSAQGWSHQKVAEELWVLASTVRHHCRGLVIKIPSHKRTHLREGITYGELLPASALIRVICGDGCISKLSRTYQRSISCDARHPELIDTYADLTHKVLGKTASKDATAKANCIQVSHKKSLSIILDLPAGAKQQDYLVPEWIFSSVEYVRPFIRGLIETDSNIYHEYRNGR